MRIVAFTDHHASTASLKKVKKLAKKKNAEYLICTGDFTMFDVKLDKVLADIDEIGIPCIILPGNHEAPSLVEKFSKNKKNLIYLHKNVKRIGNHVFLSYGGGGFAMDDPRFAKWSKKAIKSVNPNDIGVLLLHGPPHNTKLDKMYGDHVGNKSYTSFIKANSGKIRFVFCGHLHENFRKEDRIGKTRIINAGPDGTFFVI